MMSIPALNCPAVLASENGTPFTIASHVSTSPPLICVSKRRNFTKSNSPLILLSMASVRAFEKAAIVNSIPSNCASSSDCIRRDFSSSAMRWLFFSICSRFISRDLSASIPTVRESRPSRKKSSSVAAMGCETSFSSSAICSPSAIYSVLAAMVGVASGSMSFAVRMPLISISEMIDTCSAIFSSISLIY